MRDAVPAVYYFTTTASSRRAFCALSSGSTLDTRARCPPRTCERLHCDPDRDREKSDQRHGAIGSGCSSQTPSQFPRLLARGDAQAKSPRYEKSKYGFTSAWSSSPKAEGDPTDGQLALAPSAVPTAPLYRKPEFSRSSRLVPHLRRRRAVRARTDRGQTLDVGCAPTGPLPRSPEQAARRDFPGSGA
jgi:hypothetical protein